MMVIVVDDGAGDDGGDDGGDDTAGEIGGGDGGGGCGDEGIDVTDTEDSIVDLGSSLHRNKS